MANIDRIKIRHQRIRKRLLGTSERPRLSVHFSGQHIYAQIIDDITGKTLAAASTVEGEVRGERRGYANVAMAEKIGWLGGERGRKKTGKASVFHGADFLF